MSGHGTYTCPFCGSASDGSALSCSACGAPVDVKAVVGPSGWQELPGARDMARLEFGRSTCQIEGFFVPVADFNLAPGDGVYFTHHVLLWKDPGAQLTTMSLAGAWTRMLAGMPVVMMQASGPGHVALSQDAPGEIVAIPLQPGETMDVREHVLLAATANVAYNYFSTNVWLGGGQETDYPLGPFMDRFTAGATPGFVLLHGSGNVMMRRLEANERILVKPAALLYKDTSVQMHLHLDRAPAAAGASTLQSYTWLRLYGPGRVAIQSAYKHMHSERDNQSLSHSPATWRRPIVDSTGQLQPHTPWLYLENGEQRGPVQLDYVMGLALAGHLPADTLVWNEGLKDWAPVSRIAYCPTCKDDLPTISKNFWKQQGWFGRIMFFILCLPVAILFLIASYFREVTVSVCSRCGKTLDAAFNRQQPTAATAPTTIGAAAPATTLRSAMRNRPR